MRARALKVPLKDRQGNVRDYAYVSPEDSWVLERKWTLMRIGYAQTYLGGGRKNGRKAYMHRMILGLEPGDGKEVDHINRNRIDNRRENLRVTDRRGNAQNLPGHTKATDIPVSRHRGVSWHRQAGKWFAYGTVNGKRTCLGLHDDEEVAAALARAWRRQNLPYATD